MVPLAKPYFDDDELRGVREVLDSGWVVSGSKVKQLEREFESYLGIKHAVAVSSCTAALHLALLASGIEPGDKVLVADYTFPATGHSVLYTGASPVFVDVDPGTYNIDLGSIPAKLASEAKAIIPVHTFGQPCDMNEIIEIAEMFDLKVIEDAACAIGAEYWGKYAGTFGDVGCFSFHGRKIITCGEGGMLVTDDGKIAEFAREMLDFGMRIPEGSSRPVFRSLGYNYKMSDIEAAILSAQLRKLKYLVGMRRTVAGWWDRILADIPELQAPKVLPDVYHVYQSYVALVDESIDRDGLIMRLREKGIQTQIGTYSSCREPVYRAKDICPNSIDVFVRAIALPLYPDMHWIDFMKASTALKEVIEEMKNGKEKNYDC